MAEFAARKRLRSSIVFEQELANENKRRQARPAGRAHLLHN
jgi:hypothetical protein